jgi:hypothetical protein
VNASGRLAIRGRRDAVSTEEISPFEEVGDVARTRWREAQLLLDTPGARRIRTTIAAALILAAPAIARHPYLRGTRLLRIIGVAGGASLIVKAAELLRDWEPKVTTTGR